MMFVPVSYGGRVFADYNVAAGFALGLQAGNPVAAGALERVNLPPLYTGSRIGLRTVEIEFTVLPTSESVETGAARDVGYSLLRILGAVLAPGQEPRALVVRIADGPYAGDELELLAVTGQHRYSMSRNSVIVPFITAETRWSRRTDTEVPAMTFSVAAAIPLVNQGLATAYPTLKLTEVTARTTDDSNTGWKYRRTHTVTNSTTRDWWRVRYTLDLGDTQAWVSGGKAQSDGDDVRIRAEGREYNRTLTNFNRERSFAHIEIDVPAGDALTLEVWYGNPSAGSATTLSQRGGTDATYAADDLEGDTGTAESGTGTTLTDTDRAWEANRWAGGYLQITSGTGALQRRRIVGNTATTITVERAFTTAPAAGSNYAIWMSGIAVDGGAVSAKSASTITDSSQAWGVNEWAGATVTFGGGGTANPTTMTVASNTATQLTFTGSFSAQPTNGDTYRIERYGVLRYLVDRSVIGTTHRGLWRITKYASKGARVAYGDQTPGGWVPWLMLPNNDNVSLGRYIDEDATSAVSNWPYVYARRGVRSTSTWADKGVADGIAFYDPRGLQWFDWDYRLENDSQIGVVEVRTQEPDGVDWQTVASDNSLRTTLTAITSGGAAGYQDLSATNPVRLWTGVLPANGEEIPATQKRTRMIDLRANTTWALGIDLDGIAGLTNSVPALGSEEAIWDVQTSLRLGGGTDADVPYQKVRLGGADHWLALTSGQALWIAGRPDETKPLFGIYNASTGALIREAAWAGRLFRYVEDVDGTLLAQQADELLPLEPVRNLFSDGTDPAVWTETEGAGVTGAAFNEPLVDWDFDGSCLRIALSALPAGYWSYALDKTLPIAVVPGTLYEWGFAAKRNGLTNTVHVTMRMAWGDGVSTNLEDPDQTEVRTLATNDEWYTGGGGRTIYAGPPQWATVSVYGPTIEAWPSITITGSGSTTGTIYLEVYLATNGLNLYVTEDEIGTIAVTPSWREGFVG